MCGRINPDAIILEKSGQTHRQSENLTKPSEYAMLFAMWRPNKQQWWVILIFAAGGVLGGVFGQRYGAYFATVALLLGGLLLWAAEVDRK